MLKLELADSSCCGCRPARTFMAFRTKLRVRLEVIREGRMKVEIWRRRDINVNHHASTRGTLFCVQPQDTLSTFPKYNEAQRALSSPPRHLWPRNSRNIRHAWSSIIITAIHSALQNDILCFYVCKTATRLKLRQVLACWSAHGPRYKSSEQKYEDSPQSVRLKLAHDPLQLVHLDGRDRRFIPKHLLGFRSVKTYCEFYSQLQHSETRSAYSLLKACSPRYGLIGVESITGSDLLNISLQASTCCSSARQPCPQKCDLPSH